MKRVFNIALILLGAFLCSLGATSLKAQDTSASPILLMTMDGAVGPAFAEYLERGLEKAAEEDAQLVILKLNTPGGLLTSTRDMVSDIVESKTPVAIWVTPSGAHAASAGTFLLYAAHIAVMDDGTNVGAATPIQMGMNESPSPNKDEEGGEDQSKALEAKAMEDTKAFIRGLAEMRGRNVEWGESAVSEAKSITATEAFEKNVIDYKAPNLKSLLQQIDGKVIALKNGSRVTLDTQNAEIKSFEPDLRTQFLALITNPNIAFILMTIGVYGILLEFYSPGMMVGGTIGAICLIIGLFALNVLPVNGAGIALLFLGILLMAAEAFIPSFGILGLGGIVAFVFGATMIFDTSGMPGLALDWQVIAGTALVSILFLTVTLGYALKFYKKETKTGKEGLIGSTGKVLSWSGKQGRIFIDGENWHAVSEKPMKLKKDDPVEIESVSKLTLTIKSEKAE
jgi:membrane-bound serine protease (ClpP class)